MIGGGVAGLAAARAAASSGARVMLCDENPRWGGSLLGARRDDRRPAARGLDRGDHAELAARPDVSLLPRTTAFGYYDGNLVGAIERVADHLAEPPADTPRQRLWKIRARAVVLASGAIERAIAYADNDLPGTMLAGAARSYVERYAVRPGSRAVVFTNNDSCLCGRAGAAGGGRRDCARSSMREPTRRSSARCRRARRAAVCRCVHGSAIVAAHGRSACARSTSRRSAGGASSRLDCDLVCVSGGFNPAVHLYSQARGTLRYDEALATFVPDASPLPIVAARRGEWPLRSCRCLGRRPRRRDRRGRARRASRHPPIDVAAGREHRDRTRCCRCGRYPARRKSGKALRRPAERRHGRRHRARGARRLSGGRASEALHDARHGHRPGQDQQHPRARAAGRAARRADPARRHDDVPAALHAGHAWARSRATSAARDVEPTRYSAMHDWHVDARRALRQRGAVEAAALVSARRRVRGRRGEPRGAQRARQRRHRRRVHAGQDRAAGSRRRRAAQPRLHQQVGHARRRSLPLRRDAARGRDRDGRRHDVAPVRRRTT